MPQWIIMLVVNFVLRQIAKFGNNTDWAKVKADAIARIHQVVPAWLASGVDDIVASTIDIIAMALQAQEDLAAIADLLVAGNVSAALGKLVELVEKLIHTPHQYAVLETLKKVQVHA